MLKITLMVPATLSRAPGLLTAPNVIPILAKRPLSRPFLLLASLPVLSLLLSRRTTLWQHSFHSIWIPAALLRELAKFWLAQVHPSAQESFLACPVFASS